MNNQAKVIFTPSNAKTAVTQEVREQLALNYKETDDTLCKILSFNTRIQSTIHDWLGGEITKIEVYPWGSSIQVDVHYNYNETTHKIRLAVSPSEHKEILRNVFARALGLEPKDNWATIIAKYTEREDDGEVGVCMAPQIQSDFKATLKRFSMLVPEDMLV